VEGNWKAEAHPVGAKSLLSLWHRWWAFGILSVAVQGGKEAESPESEMQKQRQLLDIEESRAGRGRSGRRRKMKTNVDTVKSMVHQLVAVVFS